MTGNAAGKESMRPSALRMTPLTAALALALAPPLVISAQGGMDAGAHRERIQAGRDGSADGIGAESGIVSANDLIGRSVIGADGEVLGRISNFLLSLSGGIEHLIVASGGFLGLGGREVAIPWSEAEADFDTGHVRVTLTRGDFDEAPDYGQAGSIDAGRDAGGR
ncbi:PRC-barrel domain-containing protein [Skermanella rosea]|uniref:PRC-barrel domain-containing protein n=1 Tax=Skermanella rosea TaxID=1817965 RepID=UPI001933B5F4|nr:PRC-barrel domain-containing protein [Skermanella rosea]UEM04780.1 PRC-barrel domain-containing protein [Skermanella rosea]